MLPNPIPPPIQALLDLFSTSLADVRFADLDGQALARCASEVESAAEAVALAQSALDAAREALQERQDALLQRAQRALAYARVYAEGDEALSGRLDAVSLPRPTRRARPEEALVLSADPQPSPRPRGRPRKAPAEKAPTDAAGHGDAVVPLVSRDARHERSEALDGVR
jgi:multidrug efflux pump subunit AcrA (membrane-fusion protein)